MLLNIKNRYFYILISLTPIKTGTLQDNLP